MNKKILVTIGILVVVIALLGVYFIYFHKPNILTEQQLKQKFSELEAQYKEKKAQGYDLSEVENLIKDAKHAYGRGDYKRTDELLDKAFDALEKVPLPPPTTQPTVPPPTLTGEGFVIVCGNHFCLNGERYRFVGANKASLPEHTHQEIDDTFEEASKLGIKVMRVFVHDPLNIPNYTFENFDYMLDSAKRHKIRLIITLANNDRDPILYMLRAHPDLGDYEKIIKDREKAEEIRKSFFGDEEANELYRDFVYNLITRTNSINGIQYKQDPTIFSWELMNEPANAAPSIGILIDWIEKTSNYIKSIDRNHMISIGGEGNTKYYLTNQGENYFVKVHQIATNISFGCFHIYGRPTLNEDDFEKVLDGLIQDAHETLNKPIVMEEYGISKRKCNHTWTREGFYQFMLDEFYSKDGDGTAFWAFSARSNLTEEELEIENGISLHPDDAELRGIIKKKAKEIE